MKRMNMQLNILAGLLIALMGLTSCMVSPSREFISYVYADTPTPTVQSPTPVELINENPIFPEDSISRGDGFTIQFSQGCLNRLNIRAVILPAEVLNEFKNGLIGQWLKLLRAPGYEVANPSSIMDFEKINAQFNGLEIKFARQTILINTALDFKLYFLCTTKEYQAMKSLFATRTNGGSFKGDDSFGGSGMETQSSIYYENNAGSRLEVAHYAGDHEVFLTRNRSDPASTVGKMFYAFISRTTYAILNEGRYWKPTLNSDYTVASYMLLFLKYGESKDFTRQVLGGCAEGNVCEWHFYVIP